uniref:PHB domain-containing protein n=1 Tax=Panagrellus redivivus TaxID=6233 RepID=A0A7E4WDG7_PANRE
MSNPPESIPLKEPIAQEAPPAEEATPPASTTVVMPSDETDPVPNSDFWSRFIIGFATFFLTVTFPLSGLASFRVISEYERGILFRLGRVLSKEALKPGLVFINPFIDTIRIVDMRIKTLNVLPQAILTRDSVTVTVDAVIYTRVTVPTDSVLNVENERQATVLLGQTTLRNILGTLTLAEILSERERIATHLQEVLDKSTDAWGVKVERVEITDVSLPQGMQRSMAAIAEAEREAKARVIAADSEKAASTALKEAAQEMAATPMAFQLRYLQTLNTISAENSSTIVFPLPMEFLNIFKPLIPAV